MLIWLAGLAGGTTAGLCGVGGIAAWLIRRHAGPTPTPLPLPTITPPPQPQQPAIVPRDVWGARPVNHNAENEKGVASKDNPYGWSTYTGDLAAVYATVAIHHSYPIKRDTGTMREIQDLHLDIDKWADIGYHFGIGGDGTIYAGRDIQVRGASVSGYNSGTIGVVVIGDFESETPSSEQLRSLTLLLNWLIPTYTLTHLAGHYEFNPDTQCPGTNMKPYLGPLAQLVGLARGTGGYVRPTPMSFLPTPRKGCC